MHTEPCMGCAEPIQPSEMAIEVAKVGDQAGGGQEELVGPGAGLFFFHKDHWEAHQGDRETGGTLIWGLRAGPMLLEHLPGYAATS